jgi:hypothetical protein
VFNLEYGPQKLLSSEQLLEGNGSVSHTQAMEKAENVGNFR